METMFTVSSVPKNNSPMVLSLEPNRKLFAASLGDMRANVAATAKTQSYRPSCVLRTPSMERKQSPKCSTTTPTTPKSPRHQYDVIKSIKIDASSLIGKVSQSVVSTQSTSGEPSLIKDDYDESLKDLFMDIPTQTEGNDSLREVHRQIEQSCTQSYTFATRFPSSVSTDLSSIISPSAEDGSQPVSPQMPIYPALSRSGETSRRWSAAIITQEIKLFVAPHSLLAVDEPLGTIQPTPKAQSPSESPLEPNPLSPFPTTLDTLPPLSSFYSLPSTLAVPHPMEVSDTLTDYCIVGGEIPEDINAPQRCSLWETMSGSSRKLSNIGRALWG